MRQIDNFENLAPCAPMAYSMDHGGEDFGVSMPLNNSEITMEDLLGGLIEQFPGLPSDIVNSAGELIFGSVSEHLAKGKPVILRRFGSFCPRHYRRTHKKVGLLFHASPQVTKMLNRLDKEMLNNEK
ncbi:MAG: hypothetical protein LBE38_09415 [Deltaproteobacteria bacterium]|jgi:hypothetical protein|nr:hypothetical protein [Deltaproteobacteria bacterium]